MDCAKCDSVLEKVTVDGIEVDQCAKCSGIWLDFGELERLLDASDATALKERAAGAAAEMDALEAPCPVCGGEGNMVPVKNMEHELHIDTCTVCYGQWLDGGELETLRQKGVLDSLLSVFKRP